MFTLQNTQGYSQTECDALNAEFETRMSEARIERGSDEYHEAESRFADEVSRR